jgi:hypothetical protein
MMVKTFRTPKSKIVIAFTGIITSILVMLFIGFWNQIILENDMTMVLTYIFLIGILMVVFLFSISKSLKKIVLYESFIEIHFIGSKLKIELTQINSISILQKLPPFFMGSQGFWGFNGKINGDINARVNSLENMIFIITDDKKIILSVENPVLFIEEINKLKNKVKPC